MAGKIYSGTYTTGINLTNPAIQRPATVTGKITSTNSAAIFGSAAFAWTVNNRGSIDDTGTSGSGINLLAGGTVNNLVAASGTTTPGSLIEGYFDGVLIQAATGAVSNLGTIEGTGTASSGARMTAGGSVSNGSASVTTALIEAANGIFIYGGAGKVTNFGTIKNTANFDNIALSAGGTVTNGSSLSTAALITGPALSIYIAGGSGTVTNFGTITGSAGVFLDDGGRVTNGQSGSTAGLIVSTTGDTVAIAGTAGTIVNFGTIQETTGAVATVALAAGGTVTNGAVGATSALITGPGIGIYVNNNPGTVTNFGRIAATSTASGNGIFLDDGGTVTNFGTVQNADTSDSGVYFHGGGVVTNGKTGTSVGLISGANNGVAFRGGAGTVTNAGSITSSTANGVYLNGGGSVTNQAGGVIAGHINGVYDRGVAAAITNSGLIETTGTADGIYLRGGGSVTNNAGGTIAGSAAGVEIGQQGGIVTNHGVIKGVIGFYGEIHHSGANTLVNFGTVASTSTATGAVAVEMGSSVGNNKLLVVEPGAVFTGLVEGGGRGEIEFAATGTAAMSGNISGFNRVALANGAADSLTLANANFAGINGRLTVIGGNDGNTVNASAVTTGQLTIDGGSGADVLTGSANGGTIFVFTATELTATDTITGSSYNNELDVTTPGTVAVAGVTAVQLYQLANGGANSLTLADGNFADVLARPVNIYGGNDGNTIDGSALTGATENLEIFGGAGADVLKGGAGNDIFVFTAANLTSTDTISGGGGTNELLLTTAGTIAAEGITGVETYVLANGGANTLTLASTNFTGSTITVSDGNGGNTISVAAGVAAPDRIIVYAGAGADVLTGGAGNDVFFAGGDTTMTGGGGTNEFIISAPGTNTIADFAASTTNEIWLSNTGFNLGLSGSGTLPAGLFVVGPFAAATQRFSYVGGQLFYSPSGTTATEKLVVTLTGAPALTAAELFHTATAVTTYSGTITTLIGLSNPATQRQVVVTGTITNTTGQGIFGNADFGWTVNNRGAIVSTSTTTGDFGVQLIAGGTVNNLVAASGTATPASLIAGYGSGVLIEFAPGTVTNLGEIEDTGVNGLGIDINAGGRVSNGSAAVTTASITGPGNGVLIGGGSGTVTNFGTVEGTGSHTTVFLKAGGSIANGSSTSTTALIANTGSANGVYVGYGAGTVTNFGAIKGAASGVAFNDGGLVTNGASGLTAGLIEGGTGGAVSIAGTVGTVTNFGTLQSTGTLAVVALNGVGGGTVTNGAIGATSALITGPGTAIYVNNGAGTVTNFGHITTTSTAVGTGIVLEHGGTVTNFGTVQNTFTGSSAVYIHGAGTVTNGKTGTSVGLIAGANNGVGIRGGAGTVTNAGSITSVTNNGVYLNRGGTVTNQAGGVIAGHTNGVYDRNVAISVVNSGLIETTGTADGIYLRGGGSITNNAGGTIAGSAAGVYLHRTAGAVTNHGVIKGTIGFDAAGTGANTLINFGTVASTSTAAGAIAVEMGNNTGRNLLVVEPGAVFTGLVNGGGRGEIEFAATGTAAMGANISGFSTVALANGGADSLTLANANFAGVSDDRRITVIGGNSGNTVNASAVTTGAVTIDGGAGADVLTGAGGSANNIFAFTAAALTATDKVAGDGYSNELEITTAGTVAAGGVTAVEIYQLANGGANSLTLVNANFTGVLAGSITVYGGNAGNTINGSGLTGIADNLDIYGGAGADVLKGGAGNDIFSFAAANLTATDTVSGGAGNNELLMTTAGTVAAAGVTGVETYVLADGGANTLTLATANFTGVTGSTITVSDGNKGNTVSAAGVAAPDRTIIYAGTGADVLTGGPGTNVFYAGGNTTIDFAKLQGTNTINNFGAGTSEIVFSNTGFALGLPGATTPQALPTGLFVSDSAGTFALTTQRFAYGTSNGELFYSASGTTATEHLVASLTGDPALAVSHLFYVGGSGSGGA